MLAGEDASHIQDISSYSFQSVEIKDLSFRFDGVLAKADFSDRFYFVEVQFQKDERLFRRIFAEIMLYLYQQNLPANWHVVVIFPQRSINAGVPEDVAEYLASERLKVVYLDELSGELLQEFPLSLLNIFTAKSNEKDVATAVQQAIVQQTALLDDIDFIRFLKRLLSEKLPHLTHKEIAAMFDLRLTPFEETRYYKDLQEMEQAAKQQGLQQGLQQGERQKQEAIAYKMLRMGLSLEQVAEATELTIDEVRLLAQ